MLLPTLAWAMFATFPQDAEAKLKAAIDTAGAKHEPIVTAADKAMIAQKCGHPAGWESKNINFEKNGTLVCDNGKRVTDAETKAMSDRISKRARAYANAVVNDPGVKRAIEMVADEATKKALKKVRRDFGS